MFYEIKIPSTITVENKDLVVIGGYPIDENRISILKETILSLNKHFDILLCTHYPADIELQKLVNYYIYDNRNEFFENETVHMWYSNNNIYFEYYYGENKWKHHSAMNIPITIPSDYAKSTINNGLCIVSR